MTIDLKAVGSRPTVEAERGPLLPEQARGDEASASSRLAANEAALALERGLTDEHALAAAQGYRVTLQAATLAVATLPTGSADLEGALGVAAERPASPAPNDRPSDSTSSPIDQTGHAPGVVPRHEPSEASVDRVPGATSAASGAVDPGLVYRQSTQAPVSGRIGQISAADARRPVPDPRPAARRYVLGRRLATLALVMLALLAASLLVALAIAPWR